MPFGTLRSVGGETLGDNALEVRVDHGPGQRPFVRERDPAIGSLADPRQRRLALLKRQRPRIDFAAISRSKVT